MGHVSQDFSPFRHEMESRLEISLFLRVCAVGKDKYKIGDCVLLIDRDGSSIRRIISFYYNQENTPVALGQFIYYQNEVGSLTERYPPPQVVRRGNHVSTWLTLVFQ